MLGEKKFMPILDPEKELPKCSKCIYAFPERRTREGMAAYTCWRYPPKDHEVLGKVLTYAPGVAGDHSCGEGRWFIEGEGSILHTYIQVSNLIFNRREK
jgi:hypothetical protein